MKKEVILKYDYYNTFSKTYQIKISFLNLLKFTIEVVIFGLLVEGFRLNFVIILRKPLKPALTELDMKVSDCKNSAAFFTKKKLLK